MLVIGSDHGGYDLKEALKVHLTQRGVAFFDMGTYTKESVDYPDIAQTVCAAIVAGTYERGVLICGTGIGISIAANKVHGIRAALCGDTFSSRHSRLHNDANVLCLGGRVTGVGLACDILDCWLDTEFEGNRHAKRVDKIESKV